MAANDLTFLVRISDKVVLDRRRSPLPTGFIVPTGQQIVYGDSLTDMGVVPNAFVWNEDNPATFAPVPDVDPNDPPLPTTVPSELAEIKAAALETLARVAAIEALTQPQ